MSLWIETILIATLLIVVHVGIYLWTRKTTRKSLKDRHVVVTGGSSGIGLWVAIHCAKLGAHVTIIARNIANLEAAVQQISCHKLHDQQKIQYRSLDLSKDYDVVAKCLAELETEVGPIYYLANCAGMAICGPVDEMPVEDARRMIDVNYYGCFYPTRYVLGKMKQRGDGIITICGSQLSMFGIYGMGPYAASKFALRGLAETIAMEVCHTSINVTLALPADTDTPGLATENLNKPEETKIISSGGGLAKPEAVAQTILDDSLSGNFISIYGIESWLATIVCSGLSPWGGFGFTLLQSVLLGPLRLVAFGLQFHFRSIVKKCAAKKVSTVTEKED